MSHVKRVRLSSSLILLLAALAAGLASSPGSATEGDLPTAYDAEGRPDPFEPRLGERRHDPVCPDERPKVAELEISGVFILSGTRVAQARAGARDYLLREGDRLCDGELARIDSERVVVKRFLAEPLEVSVSAGEWKSEACVWLEEGHVASRLSCASELLLLRGRGQ